MKRLIIVLIALSAAAVAIENRISMPGSRYAFPTANLVARWSASSFAGTADNTAISTWPDISGNGYDLTQPTAVNQPHYRTSATIGGKPCVYFERIKSGVSDVSGVQRMIIPAGLAYQQANSAVFAMVDWGGQNANYPTLISFGTNATGTANYAWVLPTFAGSANAQEPAAYVAGAGIVNFASGSAINVGNGPTALLLGATTTAATATIDGMSRTKSGTYSAGTTFTGGLVGGWTGQTSTDIDGCVYEMAVYSAYPSAWQISQLQSYAREQIGARSGRRRINVKCLGDSITAGQGATTQNGWPAQLARMGNLWVSWHIATDGFPGESASTLYTRRTTYLPQSYDSGADRNIAVIFAGTNDIAFSAKTGDQAYASVRDTGIYARSLGYRVVIVTMLPRGAFNSTQNGYRDTYNSLVKGSAITDGAADAIADTTAVAALEAQYFSTYSIDTVHPNDAGYAQLASLIYAAIAGLL